MHAVTVKLKVPYGELTEKFSENTGENATVKGNSTVTDIALGNLQSES